MDMHDSVYLKKGGVRTSSRLRMLWLKYGKGFHLSYHRRMPLGQVLGLMRYHHVWIMMPPGT